jgi:acetylornithine deacetylase
MSEKEWINQGELYSLLADLVAIRSVNTHYDEKSNEKELGQHVQRLLEQWGIDHQTQEVAPDRENVIARLPGKDNQRRLLFEAHMDTVSVEGMEIEPFEPRIKDNCMYGRGSCDTKAGLAAMLYALKSTKESGTLPPATIVLAATVDEEHSFGGVAHLISEGIQADAAVVSEPTELNVIVAHKGCLRFRVVTKGRAAHSSKVHLGKNAISKMAAVIRAIEREILPTYQLVQHPLLGNPTLNIGLIQGGIQVNTVPDSCSIDIDRRTLPGEDPEKILNELHALMKSLGEADPELEVEVGCPLLEDSPLETQTDEEIVVLARKACTEFLGQARIEGVPYGTDASKLSQAGIPSIVLGPGNIDRAHTAVEFVELDQVVQATRIYRRIMQEFGE